MGKWSRPASVLDNRDVTYTDNNGVHWLVTRGGGLLANPFSKFRASLTVAPNKYGLEKGKVYYTESTRDAIQAKIDDAAYAWAIAPGNPLSKDVLHPAAVEPASSDTLALVALAVGAYLILKEG